MSSLLSTVPNQKFVSVLMHSYPDMVRSSSKRKHDDLGLATPDSLPQQNKRRQMDCLVVGEEVLLVAQPWILKLF